MGEMIRVRQEHGGSVLLVVEVEPSQVSNYGVFDVEATDDDRVRKVVGMLESLRLGMRRRIWWLPVAAFWTARFLVLSAVLLSARVGSCSLLTPSNSSSRRATPFMSWFMRGSVMTSAIPSASFPPASSSAAATRSMVQSCSQTWRPCWRSIGVSWGRGGRRR